MTSSDTTTQTAGSAAETDPRENLGVYLNDHLAGSTGGLELARGMAERHKDDELGPFLQQLAQDVEEDRDTLLAAMEKLGIEKNPIKQGLAWAGEKLGRLKLGDAPVSGEDDANDLLELEAMSLGVEGKRCLWLALEQAGVSGVDLPRLIERAQTQRDGLEQHRLRVAGRLLG